MSMRQLLNLLPNVLTLGNAICGVLAVLLCLDAIDRGSLAEGVQLSFVLIALGVVFDTIDGPLARALKAQGPLGAQLDSLSDGASFGIATAVIVATVLWGMSPTFASLLAIAWTSAVLLRLARFNVETDTSVPHLFFTGMCSPVAALFMMAAMAATSDTFLFPEVPLVFAVLLPPLMLSPIRFPDLPKHYLSRRRPPWDLLVAVIAAPFIGPALAVFLFLVWFTAQTLRQHWLEHWHEHWRRRFPRD